MGLGWVVGLVLEWLCGWAMVLLACAMRGQCLGLPLSGCGQLIALATGLVVVASLAVVVSVDLAAFVVYAIVVGGS